MSRNTTIIMATFNGQRFLAEQLKSIEKNVFQPVNILICDDCSHDKTVEIVLDYIKQSKHNISIIRNKVNLGPTRTFLKLLACVKTEYVVFCDQDDLWTVDRVQLTEAFSADILISRFEILENIEPRKQIELPTPSLLNGFIFPRFPGCCLSGKTRIIQSLLQRQNYFSLYDWVLVSRGLLQGVHFELTTQVCFQYRRHANTVTKMGFAPDGVYRACLRRWYLLLDLLYHERRK